MNQISKIKHIKAYLIYALAFLPVIFVLSFSPDGRGLPPRVGTGVDRVQAGNDSKILPASNANTDIGFVAADKLLFVRGDVPGLPDASTEGAEDIRSGGLGIRSYAVQDVADTVVNSVTLVNSDLTFNLAANQSVHVRYSLPYRLTGVTSGIKFTITPPSGSVFYSSAAIVYRNDDSIASINVVNAPSAQGAVINTTGSAIANIDFDLVNGSTAGAVTLQFAQSVAGPGENTILLRGAYAEITKR